MTDDHNTAAPDGELLAVPPPFVSIIGIANNRPILAMQ